MREKHPRKDANGEERCLSAVIKARWMQEAESSPGGCEEAREELSDNLPDRSPAGWPGPVPSFLLKVQSPGRASLGTGETCARSLVALSLALGGTFNLASGDTLVADPDGFSRRGGEGGRLGCPWGYVEKLHAGLALVPTKRSIWFSACQYHVPIFLCVLASSLIIQGWNCPPSPSKDNY